VCCAISSGVTFTEVRQPLSSPTLPLINPAGTCHRTQVDEDVEKRQGGSEQWAGSEQWGELNVGEKLNGGEEVNGGEMVCDREATPNLVASALKPPSHSTGLYVIKYLAMGTTCFFFVSLLLKGNQY